MSWFDNLRNAVTNLARVLATPRHELHDELVAKEFCQKMRALGEDPEEALTIAAMLTAAGVTRDQANIFARISSTNQVTWQDLQLLERTEVRILLLERRDSVEGHSA